MAVIDVLNDEDLLRKLQGFENQLPFALSQALNRVAVKAKEEEEIQLPKHIDRPTPFTRRAFGVKRGNKRSRMSAIFIKDIQAGYLQYQIEGGASETDIPTRAKRLNVYGNIPGKRSGVIKGRHQFVATIRGVRGVWERVGRKRRGIRLLIVLDQILDHTPRFPYFDIAEDVFKDNIKRYLSEALDRAIATAR